MAPLRPPSRTRGYTLIELLVVLIIVGVLAAVSIQGLTPNTPRAVKSAIQELEVSVKAAREAAIASGRDVNLLFVKNAGGKLQMLVVNPDLYDAKDATKAAQGTIISHTFEGSWQRYAALETASPMVSGESSPAASLEPLKTLGFTGWATSLLADAATPVGLSPRGTPQLVTATGSRSAATGGVWLGVRGYRINEKGVPYGFVFVTDAGVVGAYYKPDSQLDDATHQWQRLE